MRAAAATARGGDCGVINIPSVPFDEIHPKKIELSQLRDGQPSRLGKGAFEIRKYNGMNNFHEERENASVDVN